VALEAARGAPPATRPEKLLVVFSRGVGVDITRGLAEGFEAVEANLLEEFISESDEENEHHRTCPVYQRTPTRTCYLREFPEATPL
jgi:hypothetical protein